MHTLDASSEKIHEKLAFFFSSCAIFIRILPKNVYVREWKNEFEKKQLKYGEELSEMTCIEMPKR